MIGAIRGIGAVGELVPLVSLANSQQLTAKSQQTNGRTDGLSPIGASGSYSDDLFETVDFCNSRYLLALLGDALLVGDEGCETAIGERVLEQSEDSLERAGGYVSTDAHAVDDMLRVTDASG